MPAQHRRLRPLPLLQAADALYTSTYYLGLKTAKFVLLRFDFGGVECSAPLFRDVTRAPFFFILISFTPAVRAVPEHPSTSASQTLKY